MRVRLHMQRLPVQGPQREPPLGTPEVLGPLPRPARQPPSLPLDSLRAAEGSWQRRSSGRGPN